MRGDAGGLSVDTDAVVAAGDELARCADVVAGTGRQVVDLAGALPGVLAGRSAATALRSFEQEWAAAVAGLLGGVIDLANGVTLAAARYGDVEVAGSVGPRPAG